MQSVLKSLRMPPDLASEIQQISEISGKDFSTITKELLEEAIKMRRCPGIVFSEGLDGRRARIAGSGIEVWEVIQTYCSVGRDFKRLSVAYDWLTEQQIRAVLVYYRLYPMEIEALMPCR